RRSGAVGEGHLVDRIASGGEQDRLDADFTVRIVEAERADLMQSFRVPAEPRLGGEPRGEELQLRRGQRGAVEMSQGAGPFSEAGWRPAHLRRTSRRLARDPRRGSDTWLRFSSLETSRVRWA